MRDALASALLRAWIGKGLLACALLPVAALYGALAAVRRQLFRWHRLKSQRVNAFVIVVGNVVAGGAGKTPTVISLVRHLQAQGLRVGVVSRGFGRDGQACQAVDAASSAQEVGDEPLLIARATGAPVFVARDRHQAASALLAAHPQTDVIVCDDGLQHYRLFRDLEICVFDDRGCGNGWLLPAGPLREPWPRRGVAAAGQSAERLLVLNTSGAGAGGGGVGQYSAQRALATVARDRHGATTPLLELNAPGRLPVQAVAGIARPDMFFSMLRQTGLVLAQTQALPDHFDFRQANAESWSAVQLLCTEKDAPKLWQVAPSALSVALEQTIEPAFFAAVDQQIAAHRAAQAASRLSSDHGH
jgi:tetraacyldisaccharide 4'-kinase